MVRNADLPPTGAFTRQVADYVRDACKDRGITQKQLGELIGRDQSYVSVRMNGRKGWDTEELDAIARTLGLSSALRLVLEATT